MYNRRYDKAFLMLRQETAGYGLGQRAPWGSCVMEIKNGSGRISLTVQGLRPVRRGRYAVYAMAGEGEKQKSFFCGVLAPDTSGNGALKWDFNPDGLDDRNTAVEDLHTVAVLAESDGGFSAPLIAYFGSKADWRTYFKAAEPRKEPQKAVRNEPVKELKREPKKEAVQPKTSIPETTLTAAEAMTMEAPSFALPKLNWKREEKVPEVAQMKEAPAVEQEPRKESYHGSFRGLLEKFRMELADLQEEGIFTEKEMHRIERAGRRNLQNAVSEEAVEKDAVVRNVQSSVIQEEPTKNMQWPGDMKADVLPVVSFEAQVQTETIEEVAENTVLDQFMAKYKLLKENTDIFPFVEETTPWKCISVEELVLLEGIPMSWLKDYFILNAVRKYHHLIWKQQGKGYMIGIPGTQTGYDSRKAEKLGFGEFRSMNDSALGYWIFTKK